MNSLLTVNRHRMQTPPAVCEKLLQRADVGICPYCNATAKAIDVYPQAFSKLSQHNASDACEVGDGVYLGIAVFL